MLQINKEKKKTDLPKKSPTKETHLDNRCQLSKLTVEQQWWREGKKKNK